MLDRLRENIACVRERDPAARSTWEVLTCYPGLHAIFLHGWARACWLAGLRWLGRFISHLARFLTGIEIHPGAKLGRRVLVLEAEEQVGGLSKTVVRDGNRFDLSLCGTVVRNNTANEGGGAIFFVSNNRTGTMSIANATLSANPSAGFETAGLPGMFVIAAPGQPVITGSSITP